MVIRDHIRLSILLSITLLTGMNVLSSSIIMRMEEVMLLNVEIY